MGDNFLSPQAVNDAQYPEALHAPRDSPPPTLRIIDDHGLRTDPGSLQNCFRFSLIRSWISRRPFAD